MLLPEMVKLSVEVVFTVTLPNDSEGSDTVSVGVATAVPVPLRLTVFELAPELETVILPGLLPALVGLKRT